MDAAMDAAASADKLGCNLKDVLKKIHAQTPRPELDEAIATIIGTGIEIPRSPLVDNDSDAVRLTLSSLLADIGHDDWDDDWEEDPQNYPTEEDSSDDTSEVDGLRIILLLRCESTTGSRRTLTELGPVLHKPNEPVNAIMDAWYPHARTMKVSTDDHDHVLYESTAYAFYFEGTLLERESYIDHGGTITVVPLGMSIHEELRLALLIKLKEGANDGEILTIIDSYDSLTPRTAACTLLQSVLHSVMYEEAAQACLEVIWSPVNGDRIRWPGHLERNGPRPEQLMQEVCVRLAPSPSHPDHVAAAHVPVGRARADCQA